MHLKGLKILGTNIEEEHGFLICSTDKLEGQRINLDFPSVGATENLMLAAVYAEGRTVIANAAKEPEIVDLQNFLNAMGAKIYGAGTDSIIIDGVKKLHQVEYCVMPDRIVAGTFLVAAAITKGEILVRDIVPEHLGAVTSKLIEAGCTIRESHNSIFLKAPEHIKSVDRINTYPHPGLPDYHKGVSKFSYLRIYNK